MIFSPFFSFFLFFSIFLSCYLFFYKKILVLLLIELLVLYNVFFFCCWSHGKIFSLFFLFVFSAMMVLESVLGVSLLIMSSRCSSTDGYYSPNL